MEHNIMSKISEFAAQQEADQTEMLGIITGLQTAVTTLDKLIEDLQNSPGQVTGEDQVALDRIQSASKALVEKLKAVKADADVPPGGTPTPPVEETEEARTRNVNNANKRAAGRHS